VTYCLSPNAKNRRLCFQHSRMKLIQNGISSMRKFITAFLATGFLVLSPSLALPAGTSKAEIEKIVHDYLLEHPEILTEMSTKLQAQEKAAADAKRKGGLSANAKLIFHSDSDAFVGNAKGNVTIVEFMDYNCGWCKKSVAEVAEMTAKDKNLRVVFKEFPIFGQDSEYAARAALASARQGKYWELHQALFAQESHVTAAVVDDVAQGLGIDVAKMKTDMTDPKILQTISTTYDLAKALQIEGTPAFIIDDTLVPGYAPADQLVEHVTAVRANGCKIC
jgi:protein-disulfide isomerase